MAEPVHILIVYKNFVASVSHIGLGVSALNNAKVLNDNDILADVIPANSAADIELYLVAYPTVTHVVISAPWIPITDMTNLIRRYPRITFAVNYHSNVAFLQADVRGVELLRDYIDLDLGSVNFYVAGNSPRFVEWLKVSYGVPCVYLGNMYFVTTSSGGGSRFGATRDVNGALRIGSFGAPRVQKNMLSAAGAAVEISQETHRDVEFWMNVGREDSGVIRSIRALIEGLPGITLQLVPWTSWPQIRRIIRRMDVLMNVSYTETYNVVTADGIAEGIPSVTSDAIYWVPDTWKAHADNVPEIARIGRYLIGDPRAGHDGLLALERNNERSLTGWSRFVNAARIYKWKYLSPDAA
jgi:hypothetical protein